MKRMHERLPLDVQEKQPIDFKRYDIERGKETRIDSVLRLLKDHEQEIVDGVVRRYFHCLKGSFLGSSSDARNACCKSIPIPHVIIRPMPKDSVEQRVKECRIFFLLCPSDVVGLDRLAYPRIELRFSMDTQRYKYEWNRHNMFTSLDAFTYEGTYIGNTSLDPVSDAAQGKMLFPLHDAIQTGHSFQDHHVAGDQIITMMNELLKHNRAFPEANNTLDGYVRDGLLSEEKAQKLKSAIQDFGNYQYTEECTKSGIGPMGDCLIIPHQFQRFCRDEYALSIDIGVYSVNALREDDSVDPHDYSFWHELNVLDRSIVIDWTSRQYNKSDPFPLIYLLGERNFGDARFRYSS